MENNTLDQKRPFGVKYLIFGLLIAFGSAVIPFGLVLAGAYFAFVMFRVRPSSLALTGGLFFLVCYVFYGGLLSVALTGLALLPAVLLYVLHRSRVRSSTILAALTAADVLLLYAVICLPGILSGTGAFTAIQTFVDEMLASSRETSAAMAQAVYGAEAQTFLDTFDTYAESVSRSVQDLVVPVMCSVSVTLSIGNFLFFRLFTANRVPEIPRLPKFSTWSIPGFYTGGILAFLIGSLILELVGYDYAAAVSSTVNVLVGAPLMLQGLSTVDFLIVRRAKRPSAIRAIVYVIMGLLFPLLQSALMLLGCVEQLFHYRERIQNLPPRPPKFPAE